MSRPGLDDDTASADSAETPFGIWLVTDVYPPGCGGSGWSAHALAKTLIARGHPVDVIGVDAAVDGVTQRVFEGVRVTAVGVRKARRNPLRRLGGRDYAHDALADYLGNRLAAEPEVRIVHAQHLHSGPPAVAAAKEHGRAAVQTLRDYWPVCLHGTSWWGGSECSGCSTANLVGCMNAYWRWPGLLSRTMLGWARRRLAARQSGVEAADVVITVSDWVRRRIEREVPGARYAVLPNIVDGELTATSADTAEAPQLPIEGPYLVAAGKLLDTKGFDLMLRQLAEARCVWPLVIAGSGPERERLERQATALDFEVFFPGWIEHSSLLCLIRTARAFLLPGAWNEPLSRLLLEAMALGTPVVAWSSGGNAEHLECGENAWVVDCAADLDRALRELDDERRRDDVGAAGRALAHRRFSPEAVYPQLHTVYREALDVVSGDRDGAR